MAKTGVLLINLGTPDDTSVKSVRRYLREFLNDPRVIDIPAVPRMLLVNGIIAPFRARQSAKAYQTIWQTEGSPLLIHSQTLAQKVQIQLGDAFQVVLGMRYGNPSIANAVTQLKNCQDIVILPLFPQYASAATGSASQAALGDISKQWNIPNIKVINHFYRHPEFIQAVAAKIAEHTQTTPIDKLLLSYHGLPERHIVKSHCTTQCDKASACPGMTDSNAYCYRAQCYETARLIANTLSLNENQYCVSFQSRLGRIPWIKPYTDILLKDLYQQGIRTLAVACPSFVADCLETLEEVGIRLKTQWQNLGGKQLILVPCLNSDDRFVACISSMIQAQS